jgi:hypothetical protein
LSASTPTYETTLAEDSDGFYFVFDARSGATVITADVEITPVKFDTRKSIEHFPLLFVEVVSLGEKISACGVFPCTLNFPKTTGNFKVIIDALDTGTNNPMFVLLFKCSILYLSIIQQKKGLRTRGDVAESSVGVVARDPVADLCRHCSDLWHLVLETMCVRSLLLLLFVCLFTHQ